MTTTILTTKKSKKKTRRKKGRYVLEKKKKCHSTSNNRATELEAAELIPHGLSHHNDYLFLTNGNSNLLILWLHFCGLTFHMSQETSASPPCLNPPRLNWSHVWHTNEKATCKHRAFDGLNSAYPRDKRKPDSRIFTCNFLPKMPPESFGSPQNQNKPIKSVTLLSWISATILPNIPVFNKKKIDKIWIWFESGWCSTVPAIVTHKLDFLQWIHTLRLPGIRQEVQKTPKWWEPKVSTIWNFSSNSWY